MSYLLYLCLLAHRGVQHTLCCVFFCFFLFFFVLLPVSLDCPFLIAHSVFSNVYYKRLTFGFYKDLSCARLRSGF